MIPGPFAALVGLVLYAASKKNEMVTHASIHARTRLQVVVAWSI